DNTSPFHGEEHGKNFDTRRRSSMARTSAFRSDDAGSTPAASARNTLAQDTTLSSAANDVTLLGSSSCELEVKVMKNGEEVKEFRDVKGSEPQAEFQEAKKEAHKKLLQRYFSDKIGKSKEEGKIDGTEFQYVIGDNVEGGKINRLILIVLLALVAKKMGTNQNELKYQTISTSAQDIRIESCSSCNPFYTGASASEIKVGAVEKFRQRAQKVKAQS
ncbi:6389_t:CDS:2, partial [Ambispora gerdemannii]